MSDDLTISAGGVVAVSSESLRDAAAKALAICDLVLGAKGALEEAIASLGSMTVRIDVEERASSCREELIMWCHLMSMIVTSLLRAADIYEVAELTIQLEVAGSSREIELRIADLTAGRPGIKEAADELLDSARDEWTSKYGGQDKDAFRFLPGMALAARSGIPLWLTNKTQTKSTDVSRVAPQGAEDLAKLIPEGENQIRVEKYEMPDGSNRFIVSVAGTRSWSLGGLEPLNLGSNIELYLGRDAASLEAIRQAMEDAGVQPGDWVMVNAHSQAAMATDRMSSDPDFDIDMMMRWGDPLEGPAPDNVVVVDVKHYDDPVGKIGGPEYPLTTGDPSSFEVKRDTGSWILGDGSVMGGHIMSGYVETGEMMDQSGDSRLDALYDPLAALQQAEQVTVTEYDYSRQGGERYNAYIDNPDRPQADARSWDASRLEAAPLRESSVPLFEFSDPFVPSDPGAPFEFADPHQSTDPAVPFEFADPWTPDVSGEPATASVSASAGTNSNYSVGGPHAGAGVVSPELDIIDARSPEGAIDADPTPVEDNRAGPLLT